MIGMVSSPASALAARSRVGVAAVGGALVAVLLAGCGASDWNAPAPNLYVPPEPAPVATAAPVVPHVPIRDAALTAAQVPDAPPAPVRLEVPGVGIDMSVDPVGVTDAGTMELPEDADRAGWYEYGPTPSDARGSTLVAAHVDSRLTGIGPFARLREVTVGSPLTLTTADGVAHSYVVASVVKTPKDEAPVDEWFDRTGTPRLVLVTCGGQWIRAAGHYSDNVVVTASPVAG